MSTENELKMMRNKNMRQLCSYRPADCCFWCVHGKFGGDNSRQYECVLYDFAVVEEFVCDSFTDE